MTNFVILFCHSVIFLYFPDQNQAVRSLWSWEDDISGQSQGGLLLVPLQKEQKKLILLRWRQLNVKLREIYNLIDGGIVRLIDKWINGINSYAE